MAEDTTSRDEPMAKLRARLAGIRYAMLTTQAAGGTLRSRPMMTQETAPDGQLWFFTSTKTAKAEDIRDNQQVNVTFIDEAQRRFVSVSGRATLVHDRDKAEELWRAYYRAWFPGGPDDPDVALIRVTVEEAQYWDLTGNRLVQLAGFAKALLTGEAYESGTTGRIERHS